MKEVKEFNWATTSGAQRADGVIRMLVAFWAETGLQDLEQVADTCDFSAIFKKQYTEVGRVVLEKHPYFLTMMRDLECGSFQGYALKIMRSDSDVYNSDKIAEELAYTLAKHIGRILVHDWWPKNAKRINKERQNHKEVVRVMES